MSRKIDILIQLQGEKEYNAAIKRCKAELTTLKAELKSVEAQFAGQANTLNALEAKHSALQKVLEKTKEKVKIEADQLQNSKKSYEEYTKKLGEAEEKLAALRKAKESESGSTKKYNKDIDEATKKVELYRTGVGNAEKAIQRHTTSMAKATTEQYKLDTELQKTDKYLDEARKSFTGCATSIDEFGDSVEQSEKALRLMADALISKGVNTGLKELVDLLKECAQASIDFESAITGVAKTTGFSDTELAALGKEIKQLSLNIPLTTTEIAKVAEVAGQLGVAKEDIISFTTVMANLGASTDMSAEEAATALAQFASITGMSADNYERLGSAIVALGNNYATTESLTATMAKNIAAAGTNAGMTEAEMLGLSAAVTSLGVEASYGGTSISRLLQEMQMAVVTGEDLDAWAKASGMSAAEFARVYREDASEALIAFIMNMGSLGDEMTLTLHDLGITESRVTRVIQSLANAEEANGRLSGAIALANTSWSENNALTEEANKRYETTESKLTILKNSASNLAAAVGDDLNPIINTFASGGADALEALTGFVENNPLITASIASLTAAFGVLSASIVVTSLATTGLGKALVASASAAFANPVTGIIAVVLSATAALVVLCSQYDALSDAQSALIEQSEDDVKASRDSMEAEKQRSAQISDTTELLIELIKQEEKTVAEKSAIKGLCEELNELVPQLNIAYDEEENRLYDVATGADVAAASVAQLAYQEAVRRIEGEKEEHLTQLYVDQIKAQGELGDVERELADARQRSLQELVQYGEILPETAGEIANLERKQRLLKDSLNAIDEEIANVTNAVAVMIDGWDRSPDAYMAGAKTIQGYIDGLNSKLGEANVKLNKYNTSVQYTHAQGLSYVPKDDYVARLHEGEMVLNRAEARVYREAGAASEIQNNTVMNIYPQNLSEAQVDYLFQKFNARLGGALS